jgi:hypothetical protein
MTPTPALPQLNSYLTPSLPDTVVRTGLPAHHTAQAHRFHETLHPALTDMNFLTF